MPAGKEQSREEVAEGGYCGRADLIKHQAAVVAPSTPHHPISLPQSKGIKVTITVSYLPMRRMGGDEIE